MTLLENEFARRDPQGVELRPAPARLAWRLDGLSSSDHHELRVRFVASVQVPDNATDRRVFVEVILNKLGPVTMDTVAKHFQAALFAAAQDLLREKPAEEWLDPDCEGLLRDTLKAAAERVAFSSGLQILPPFICEVRSPSFERSQRAAQQVAVQSQSLARAAQLLQQFNALRDAAPNRSAGELLSHLSPGEQSEMLTALLAAGGQSASDRQLYAVSGSALLRIDPREQSAPQVILESDAIGPFRSINVNERSLLIGGQRGVLQVHPASSAGLHTCAANVTSDFGFNAAIKLGETIYATHVEAGLLAWRTGDVEPSVLFRSFIPVTSELRGNTGGNTGASVLFSNASLRSGGGVVGPRHLVKLGETSALFAVGHTLHLLAEDVVRDLASDAEAVVIALLPLRDTILIVRKDGRCQTIDRESHQIEERVDLHRDLRAATLLPWMSSPRLIIADNSGALDCVGLEDSAIVRFHSPNLEMRMLCACEDRIAAVASDRQRVQIWSLANPRVPLREVHIAALTRHRIAAIAFA